MKQKPKKYLQILLRLLVSGLALYYVLHKTDLTSLKSLILQSNLLLLAIAAIFFIGSKVLSAYRLNIFFRAGGLHISEKTNLRLYWLGMFYNLFLPGGIGGDGYKVYYLNRNMDAPVKKSILAILFDRVTGLFALIILCLLFAVFIPGQILTGYQLMLTMAVITGLFYFVVYRWFSVFYRYLHLTNFQSFGVQLAQVVSAWLILRALGYDQQTLSYLFVFLISSVVAVIPFTIGGVGARELTFLYAADQLSLDLATSISLSLLFFMITALVSLIGIVFILRPGLINTPVISGSRIPAK